MNNCGIIIGYSEDGAAPLPRQVPRQRVFFGTPPSS